MVDQGGHGGNGIAGDQAARRGGKTSHVAGEGAGGLDAHLRLGSAVGS